MCRCILSVENWVKIETLLKNWKLRPLVGIMFNQFGVQIHFIPGLLQTWRMMLLQMQRNEKMGLTRRWSWLTRDRSSMRVNRNTFTTTQPPMPSLASQNLLYSTNFGVVDVPSTPAPVGGYMYCSDTGWVIHAISPFSYHWTV